MNLHTLYARHEPTTDTVAISHGLGCKSMDTLADESTESLLKRNYFGKLDTVLYYDPECTKVAGRYPWHYSNKPRKSSKYTMLYCYRYTLVWLEPHLPRIAIAA